MALMTKTVFKGIADRMAKQYSFIKVCFDALSSTGNGTNYYDMVTNTNDPDVELAMLQASYNADVEFETNTPQKIAKGLSSYTNLISSFESHLQREGSLSLRTWDAYCEAQDVRVSDYTNQIHYSRNNTYMNARNVFSEDDTTFASAEMTGATALTFTDGDDFGDGAAATKADGNNFAGTQLKAVVTGSNTIASSLVVDIAGLDENGATKTLTNVSIAGSPGTEVVIGATTDLWVDVTGITRVSGGALNDEFELHNIKERTVDF
jgi:hypothetical protein